MLQMGASQGSAAMLPRYGGSYSASNCTSILTSITDPLHLLSCLLQLGILHLLELTLAQSNEVGWKKLSRGELPPFCKQVDALAIIKPHISQLQAKKKLTGHTPLDITTVSWHLQPLEFSHPQFSSHSLPMVQWTTHTLLHTPSLMCLAI